MSLPIPEPDLEAHEELCRRIARVNRFITAAGLPREMMIRLKLYLHEKGSGDTLQPFYLEAHAGFSPKRTPDGGREAVGFGDTLELASTNLLVTLTSPSQLLGLWEDKMNETVDKRADRLAKLRVILNEVS